MLTDVLDPVPQSTRSSFHENVDCEMMTISSAQLYPPPEVLMLFDRPLLCCSLSTEVVARWSSSILSLTRSSFRKDVDCRLMMMMMIFNPTSASSWGVVLKFLNCGEIVTLQESQPLNSSDIRCRKTVDTFHSLNCVFLHPYSTRPIQEPERILE